MEDAVITELDDDEIRVELYDSEIIISGRGKVIIIRADLTNKQMTEIRRAVDAVSDSC